MSIPLPMPHHALLLLDLSWAWLREKQKYPGPQVLFLIGEAVVASKNERGTLPVVSQPLRVLDEVSIFQGTNYDSRFGMT